jgi:hypothetical protein
MISASTVGLLRCMSPLVALLGPREMSDLSPQSETKRTLIRSLSPIHDFMSTRPDSLAATARPSKNRHVAEFMKRVLRWPPTSIDHGL